MSDGVGEEKSVDGKAKRPTALPARQQQVLRGVRAGESSKETAARLRISVRTVEVHKARMMKTLGVHSSFLALLKATERGLIVVKRGSRKGEVVIRMRKRQRNNV